MLIECARGYAGCGWPIFPILPIVDGRCKCGGVDCAGKHPAGRGWQRSIVPSADGIEGLWAERLGPRGIALLCGVACWALDIDPRHSGDRTLRALQERHGPLPPTVCSRTGGGGWHLLFAAADHVPTRAGIAPGLDVRGDRGYIVLPPSPHISGRAYEWIAGPCERALARPPAGSSSSFEAATGRLAGAAGRQASRRWSRLGAGTRLWSGLPAA